MTEQSGVAEERDFRWLEWAKRLQTMSQTGLTYARDSYDIARYREIAQIAMDMMAQGSGASSERLLDIFSHETGHATPKIDVRVAAFRHSDHNTEILLVRERRDGHWTLPGGWVDVGETPSEAAVREVSEESGYVVRVIRVLAVWDKRKHPHPPQPFYVCKLVFEAEIVDSVTAGGDGIETDSVAFYTREGLPPLSLDRNLPSQIDRLFDLHAQGPNAPTLFD
jgi:ADP-ribose pyrophosphatase YjhB (NUDIX family)